MGMYICVECSDYVDDDMEPGLEYKGGLVCPSCFEILNAYVEDHIETLEQSDKMTDAEILKWAEEHQKEKENAK